jgi:hypothetical protein
MHLRKFHAIAGAVALVVVGAAGAGTAAVAAGNHTKAVYFRGGTDCGSLAGMLYFG